MSDMMKDLRESIMIDVKYLMNENMKECMREMTASIGNDIITTIKNQLTQRTMNSK